MNSLTRYLITCGFIVCVSLSACAAKPTPTGPSEADQIGTRAAELAASFLTGTAAAASPTPQPTLTPEPTATETLTPTPAVVKPPKITGFAPCYVKPSIDAVLTSNISDSKVVELLAIGSIPGWYKILNPYFHTACWVQAEHLVLDPNMDLSGIPTE